MDQAEATKPLRLLLVDDHPILRAGLNVLLSSEPDLMVAAEANDGEEALALVAGLNPDLVLMDFSLPGLNGAETTRAIKRDHPKLMVLALSVHEEVSFVRLLLDAGANGYALKRSACDELVRAVRIVAAGGSYVDPSIASQLLRVNQRRKTPAGVAALHPLSDRETEVVRLLAEGLTMKEMAERLVLSPRTLETYRARALEKLELRTRAQLVRYAIQRGWLQQR